ncbi:hypothetical protein FBUS_04954 [Fasciolopsis buskii]|uniref:Uncharacterized protein n=1 Tax=Fasciolopsis buskii TaxID=27845 RepID=A0A8E0VLF6_9TREM|nr:hypothetical protein FBUS_04954 [Fasciolopsis buski]
MIPPSSSKNSNSGTQILTKETKSTFGNSLKLFLSRLFRPPDSTKNSECLSKIVQPSCIVGCTRSYAPSEVDKLVPPSESSVSLVRSSWKPYNSTSQPTEIPPPYIPEYMLEQVPCDTWSAAYKLQGHSAIPRAIGRLLQCPFCLHVASESDFQTVIMDALDDKHSIPSHSAQTLDEFDEINAVASLDYISFINPLHGSMMTDSGISIESDKISTTRLASITSAPRTPSPQKTPTCFHLSSDPPPSPAPPPVTLLSPVAINLLLQSQAQCCPVGSVDKSATEQGHDDWPISSKTYTDSSSPEEDRLDETYRFSVQNELTMKNDSIHRENLQCAFWAAADYQVGSGATSSISIDDVFSCAAIQETIEAETRTQIIQSRTRDQINSLLEYSLGINKNALINPDYGRSNDARMQLRNELAILKDAKNVINRQMEELKNHCALIMQGKLSLPLVDRSKSRPVGPNNNLPEPYVDSPTVFAKERSYSVGDLRFIAF